MPTFCPAKTWLRFILRRPIQMRPHCVTVMVRSWARAFGCKRTLSKLSSVDQRQYFISCSVTHRALLTQMAQTAVCNRHHTLEQQLCRWLLLSLDRLQGNEIVMTQELIANMLDVPREGVTKARLNCRGRVSSDTHAAITVLDRGAWKKGPASVTKWLKTNMSACFPAPSLNLVDSGCCRRRYE
jgi:hypothetical protein